MKKRKTKNATNKVTSKIEYLQRGNKNIQKEEGISNLDEKRLMDSTLNFMKEVGKFTHLYL